MWDDETRRKHILDIQKLLDDISGTKLSLVVLELALRNSGARAFDRYSCDAWAQFILRSATRRLLLFLDQNLQYVETLGVLALTRYIFELAIWVRLLAKDRRYALVYYREQIDTMAAHNASHLKHLTREAELFKRINARENQLTMEAVQRYAGASASTSEDQLMHMGPDIMAEVDRNAAKSFSVFFDDATTNGYGFQAYLIETQAIPKANAAASELAAERDELAKQFGPALDELARGRWQWKAAAVKVGVEHEYDFIYSYTSKLLHATPAGLTTLHQNLEPFEIRLFLRYVLVTINELIDLIGGRHFEDLRNSPVGLGETQQ